MKREIIYHSRPAIGRGEMRAVAAVLRSGDVSRGNTVRRFEEDLARYTGVRGAAALNSGTSALHLGFLAMGLGGGDEVLIPSYVCTAPLNAAHMAGARPVMCDIEPESFNMSSAEARDRATPSSRAVIVPHMFGAPADLEEILEGGVPVIEDCAQAIGASYGSKKAGATGLFSICSFYANKLLTCGEGGAVLSDDLSLLAEIRDRRDYDQRDDYRLRYNYKMTDIQAAMGIVQLARLDGFVEKRRAQAARYDKAFGGLDLTLPRGEFDHVYYRYVVRLRGDARDLITYLRDRGVHAARPVFKPLHRYFEMRSGFRNTDEAYSTAVSLPVYPGLSARQQDKVIRTVRSFFSRER